MIKPQLEEAKKYFDKYTVIPVCKEIFADIKTSVEVVRNFMEKNKKSFLLESVGSSQSWGRYSFIGYNPKFTVKCMDNKIFIKAEEEKEIITNDPATLLRNIISQYKSPKLEHMPPFTGGFVGYFSYDFFKYNEKSVNILNSNNDRFDDFYLMLFDTVVAFDHLKQKIFIVVNTPVENFENEFKKTEKKIKEIEELIKNILLNKEDKSKLKSDFKMLYSKEEFKIMIEKIKHHIFEGDIFQAVISNRAEADFEGSLLKTYRILRTINPSPYMFYLSFGDIEIAGASPETLVTLKGEELTNYALAGTCIRGKNDLEDKMLILQLLKDEKEIAEHNMLVDLGRNDLGKISEFGSVAIAQHMKILKFSHVSHIASVIKSRIKKEYDHLDALSAVLPAGTLSGAPKKIACEIINKLEKHKRGTYGGAVGYIDFTGNMDMCIAIRMVKFQNGKVYVQAGAGIVADSNPEKEYNECCQKAQAIINALKLAAQTEEL
ncbi:MAG: anthranilate synthase component I family protein [Endomicrobium sp.]|nr:anthranilate synthase component I family protein [Endomicrobium sp.]